MDFALTVFLLLVLDVVVVHDELVPDASERAWAHWKQMSRGQLEQCHRWVPAAWYALPQSRAESSLAVAVVARYFCNADRS